MIEHGHDLRPLVADSRLSYDKPIGFAWPGAPLVAAFGSHVGLRLLSLVGTFAFLLTSWRFVCALGVLDDGGGARPRGTDAGDGARLARIAGEGGGAGEYVESELAPGTLGALLQAALCFALGFGLVLAFAIRRASSRRELLLPFAALAAPYVAGLMVFPTSYDNMR